VIHGARAPGARLPSSATLPPYRRRSWQGNAPRPHFRRPLEPGRCLRARRRTARGSCAARSPRPARPPPAPAGARPRAARPARRRCARPRCARACLRLPQPTRTPPPCRARRRLSSARSSSRVCKVLHAMHARSGPTLSRHAHVHVRMYTEVLHARAHLRPSRPRKREPRRQRNPVRQPRSTPKCRCMHTPATVCLEACLRWALPHSDWPSCSDCEHQLPRMLAQCTAGGAQVRGRGAERGQHERRVAAAVGSARGARRARQPRQLVARQRILRRPVQRALAGLPERTRSARGPGWAQGIGLLGRTGVWGRRAPGGVAPAKRHARQPCSSARA